MVTFGGAYAVLAYMTQTVVADFGWITTPQMIDALGLAETTPGPLILVTEFVALLAGFQSGRGRAGACRGRWRFVGTFIPCFLWIFLAGPIWTRSRHARACPLPCSHHRGGGRGDPEPVAVVCAACAFQHVNQKQSGPLSMPVPDLATIQPVAAAMMALAALLVLRLESGLGLVLALMALLAGAISDCLTRSSIKPPFVSYRIPYAGAVMHP